ncbi:MAG TPA: PHP-associated domain-containing protein [Xanthomonadales bacterium]|nr:PHP-associated domain-containing protein [Xanthomonadales bacterium]
MITTEAFNGRYEVVFGNASILKKSNVQLADLHVHKGRDTLSTARGMMLSAVEKGIDVIALATHDRAPHLSRRNQRLADDLPLEVIQASEMTVMPLRDEKNHKGKHVLVFEQKGAFEPCDTWGSTYRRAESQEALLFVAHPELHDISFNDAEIEIMIKMGMPPHGIEGLNGGGVIIDNDKRIEWVMASRLPQRVKDMFPPPGSNTRALEIYNTYEIPGLSAGSDAHKKDKVGLAVAVYPEGMTVFDAMREGEILLAREKDIKQPSIPEVAAIYVRGMHLDKPSKRSATVHDIPGIASEELVV